MCTLAVAFQVDRRWPIVVAANRDERVARAAEGWAVREPATGPRYAAPRDALAGGTWMGVSEAGVFAAVTNRHVPGKGPDLARRSRGELVGRALGHRSAAASRGALEGASARLYNPFHLLVADPASAFLWTFDGDDAALVELAPGLHVVTERAADGRCPRGDLVRARWPVEPAVAPLRALLALHAEGQDATCIHREPQYGTRSSAVLRLAPSLHTSELWAADGPPCAAPFEDRSSLLSALARLPRP